MSREERCIHCVRCNRASIWLKPEEPDRICMFCEGEELRQAGYWPTPLVYYLCRPDAPPDHYHATSGEAEECQAERNGLRLTNRLYLEIQSEARERRLTIAEVFRERLERSQA